MLFRSDKSRRAETFDVGDEAVLSTRNLHSLEQHLPVKLRKRWVGPFKVEAVISPVAYRLELPPGWRIHRTFHIGNLKRFHRSSEFECGVVPPPPELVEGELEYEVEGILRHTGKGARRRYLVMWRGYPLTEATWEPESHLTHAPAILEDYLRRVHEEEQRARTRGRRRRQEMVSPRTSPRPH